MMGLAVQGLAPGPCKKGPPPWLEDGLWVVVTLKSMAIGLNKV